MSKKKILITGSCGFIFGNFVRKIIYGTSKDPENHNYSVCSIDKVNYNIKNSIYINKNHSFHIADIRDKHVLDVIFQFEKPDIVIHGAAETGVDASITNPNSYITSNVVGTQNIIDACLKNNASKLVYISTDEVYGHLNSENDTSWIEEDQLNPRNPYSASKASGEMLVKAAHNTFGLKYNIIRCSNNYGPRQTTNKLIPRIIKCIINNQPIPVYGQGMQIRDWTHVFDNCSAILNILNNGQDNEIYNIGANQELPNIEVVNRVCNIIGSGHNLITHIDDPRPGHDFRYSVNSNKIRSLGWSPSYKFNNGLQETVNWYLNNKWFLK